MQYVVSYHELYPNNQEPVKACQSGRAQGIDWSDDIRLSQSIRQGSAQRTQADGLAVSYLNQGPKNARRKSNLPIHVVVFETIRPADSKSAQIDCSEMHGPSSRRRSRHIRTRGSESERTMVRSTTGPQARIRHPLSKYAGGGRAVHEQTQRCVFFVSEFVHQADLDEN